MCTQNGFAWQQYAAYAQKHTMRARNTKANLASWILHPKTKMKFPFQFFKLKKFENLIGAYFFK